MSVDALLEMTRRLAEGPPAEGGWTVAAAPTTLRPGTVIAVTGAWGGECVEVPNPPEPNDPGE